MKLKNYVWALTPLVMSSLALAYDSSISYDNTANGNMDDTTTTLHLRDDAAGQFLSHEEAIARGGVGNIAPSVASEEEPITPMAMTEPNGLGIFLDHQTTVALGGIGNIVETGFTPDRSQNAGISAQGTTASSADLNRQSPLHFSANSTELRGSEREDIKYLASILKDHPDQKILVVGYADSKGSDQYNQKLSVARATAVKSLLVQYGADPSQVQTEGRGESRPIASNSDNEGRALNRRVEFYALG
jgi:outer membrane protein OmpA-like peptidoglycan-associated protein